MFYLLDDAFRIGEYIVSGEFMGTVESFSLRSVRLRHHNGPVYTIPFGDLGAVQNLSRDFYIDKFKFTVTYDSDLDKAGKLIKQLGRQLMQDPEVGPLIIEPMKLQRVDNFGEYGIVLKCKMMVRPGQFGMVRRKAFPLIKKLFEENGIEFAFPTVKIAEGDHGDHDSELAAAQKALTTEASKQAAV
jgi:small-conductance mechanosensitive channel